MLLYASPSPLDYVLILIGTVCALACGVPFPVLGILFGELVDEFNVATCAVDSNDSDRYLAAIKEKVLIIVYLAVAILVLIYVYVSCWRIVSERLALRIRKRYFASLLRQDISFFDSISAGEVSSRLDGEIQAIQSASSEKVGIFMCSVSFFITAFTIAFIKEAEMAGMLVSLIPAFLILAVVGGGFLTKFSARVSTAMEQASSITSEALSNMVVVQTFGAASRLESKFASHVHDACRAGS